MKLLLLVVAALLAVASCDITPQEDLEFHAWKLALGRSYNSTTEEENRKAIWLNHYRMVMDHNVLADQGMKSYRLGMNKYADLENEEYKRLVSGSCFAKFNVSVPHTGSTFLSLPEEIMIPDTVDWRAKGYVTDVQDQEACSSCWAFSATGALEGQHFKKTGKLVPLSKQQLVDCTLQWGNEGCDGGLVVPSFEYLKIIGGSNTEKSYPYEAKDGACRFHSHDIEARCSGHVEVPKGEEVLLEQAVATIGPISVGIDSSHLSFQLYKSGVYDNPDCSSTDLDHAMLVVGYGSDSGSDYWLVKNSWGLDWGDDGYIMMSRNKNNQCGIATLASYPLV